MAVSQRVHFPGHDGIRLAGKLILPDAGATAVRGYGVFAHCFTCGKDLRVAHLVSRALADAGYAALRFDAAGLGESEGAFARTNFSTLRQDLLAACQYVEQAFGPVKYLFGHSLGGAAALMAMADLPTLRTCITLNAPSDVRNLRQNLEALDPQIALNDAGEVLLGGKRFAITGQFLEDLEQHALLETVSRSSVPVLFLQSLQDQTVNPQSALALFHAAPGEKGLLFLEMEHLVSNPQDAGDVAQQVLAWLGRALREEPLPQTAP